MRPLAAVAEQQHLVNAGEVYVMREARNRVYRQHRRAADTRQNGPQPPSAVVERKGAR